mmetsp:Transcript_3425/g.15060  ORF Transcript_3425/g.15060 Transcript_3425/m.15060 type:complete len:427 (+) Transcript_3425:216-1496(+)
MCPLRPCSNPTAVGVFVRDTASWIRYSPQATEKILAGYSETLGLSVSDLLAGELTAKDGEPGSPRSVLPGAPRASPSPAPGRVDLGSLGLDGGAYVVDTVAGTQVSPRGFTRPVLFVFPDARSRERFARALEAGDAKCECAVAAGDAERSKSIVPAVSRVLLGPVVAAFRVFHKKKPPPSPSREGTGSCICLPAALTRKIKDDAAAADRQKAAPTAQIAANTKEEFEIKTAAKLAAFKIAKAAKKARQKAAKEAARRKEEVLGKVRKVLDANRNAVNAMATTYTSAEVSEVTLDTESPHVKKFVELALEASLGSGDLDIVLGYHGTSVDRAEAIVAGGFCPKKRVAKLGAYFSGELTVSYQHAARFGSRGSILLVALIRDGYLGHNEFTRRPNSLRRLAGGDVVGERFAAFAEHACLPLVHVRGVC